MTSTTIERPGVSYPIQTIGELQQFAVFDTETTGVDFESDRIVTAFVGLMSRDGQLVQRWEWLLDPEMEIPEGAAAVHGISTERAQAEGAHWASGIIEISDCLEHLLDQGIPVVAYNARFDFTMLDRNARTAGVRPIENPAPILDPFVTDKAVDRFRKGKRTLTDTCRIHGVKLGNAHEAEADAVAAGLLMWKLIDKMRPHWTTESMHGTTQKRAAEQAASLQAYFDKAKPHEKIVVHAEWPVVPAAAEVAA